MSGEARFLRGQLVRSNRKWARGADGRWQTRADAKPGAPDYFGTAELSLPGADPAHTTGFPTSRAFLAGARTKRTSERLAPPLGQTGLFPFPRAVKLGT